MHTRHGQAGLSLVEVVVAVAVLVLALTPLLSLFVTSRFNVEDSTRRNEAISLARSSMDQVVSRTAWADIQSEGPAAHPDNPDYTLTVGVSDARAAYIKDVHVTVAWQVRGKSQRVELYSAVHRRE